MRSLLPSHTPRPYLSPKTRPIRRRCHGCGRIVKNYPIPFLAVGWCCVTRYVGPGHPWRHGRLHRLARA